MIELETMKNLLKREQWIKNEIDYMINEKEKVEAEYSGAGGMKLSFEGKAPYKTNHDSKLVELTHRLGFKYIYNGMNLLEYIEYMEKELNLKVYNMICLKLLFLKRKVIVKQLKK